MPQDRQDRIYGSLLGLVFADALGAEFEGVQREQIQTRFTGPEAVLEAATERSTLRYTDDGQMALALTEYLADHGHIDPDQLMRYFVRVYEPSRGYGRGARALIEAFRDQGDYEFLAQQLFPGGSLGNGAAMRSAPVGLRFAGDEAAIWQQARNSAWPTHRHELGIEGAQLVALATAIALTDVVITPVSLADRLLPACRTLTYQKRIRELRSLRSVDDIAQFGNGIEAHESTVTALACFALSPDDYRQAIATAIWQGGDTDTIAAMTGALVGAHRGAGFADGMPVEKLEDGADFLASVQRLCARLIS